MQLLASCSFCIIPLTLLYAPACCSVMHDYDYDYNILHLQLMRGYKVTRGSWASNDIYNSVPMYIAVLARRRYSYTRILLIHQRKHQSNTHYGVLVAIFSDNNSSHACR